jgi:ABC-type multidrug transport system fused ATPase/permease subunit
MSEEPKGMTVLPILRQIYSILPEASRKQVMLLLFLMLINAFSEVGGVAGLLPFFAVAGDPTMIQTQPVLHWLYLHSGSPNPHQFLIYLGMGFMGLLVAMNIFNASTFWYSLRFSYDLGYRLSVRVLSGYLARPYLWYLKKNTSELANVVLAEIDALAETVVLSTAEMLTMSMVALFLVTGLVFIDPVVAFSTAVALGLLYGQIYRFTRDHLDRIAAQRLSMNAGRHQAVQEALNAMKEARSMTRRGYFLRSFSTRAEKLSRYRALEKLIAELPRYGTETLAVATIGAILIYLVYKGATSHNAIPLVGLYIMATWRLVPALQTIYRNSVRVRFHGPLVQLVQAELADVPADLIDPATLPRMDLRTSIKLEDVSFTYPGNRVPALHNLSLEITRGSVVALVGRTGSGKSTLADVLAGLVPAESGRVSVDGQALTDGNRMQWLRNVGYVPQDIYMTDDTVARNVALGYPQDAIDMDQVRRAAVTARLAGFVDKELAQGFDTPLGERGISLSGGQRQRIGIARALYENPEFMIFDEATSALDNLTEREVMEAIQELAGQKTMVLIAHRLTTVQLCDQIYLLEDGRLLAQGTYQELLANSPDFALLAQNELNLAPSNI